jgi:hypothetical protein
MIKVTIRKAVDESKNLNMAASTTIGEDILG